MGTRDSMAYSTLSIWCNAKIPAEAKVSLRAGIGENRIIFADETTSAAPVGANTVAILGALPADADIAFGQPDPVEVMRSERLRWVHLNSAGYTRYDRDDLRTKFYKRGAVLTNSSNVYSEPAAQHLLAMMLTLARQLPHSFENQRSGHIWSFHDIRSRARLLNSQTVLLLGFGHIARRLSELLAPLGMNVVVVRQRVRGDEPARVFTEAEIEDVLPSADHVVNILPSSPATTNFLNAKRLSLMKHGAILYNIGRGTTVDQKMVMERLQSGHLVAAYLDVTDPEPLPPEHPLWETPNCYITPHIAGGHSNEMERLATHFLDNFRRFTQGEPLLNRVL